jgi:hypothetical protein
MGEKSLVNIGDLGKPIDSLINRISDGIGGLAKPWQIKRTAAAEAEAYKIKSLVALETATLIERAQIRKMQEAASQQENIESISYKATEFVEENAEPEKIDSDFFPYLFDKAKHVSNDEMQTLWAKIIAGEANTPGTIKKKTIDVVATLEKRDAEIFTRLCANIVNFDGSTTGDVPFDVREVEIGLSNTKPYMMTFEELTHLEYLGLIKFNPVGGYHRTYKNAPFVIARYFTEIFIINPNNDGCATINTGKVLFTGAGLQLAPFSGAEFDKSVKENFIKSITEQGYTFRST